jgi:hypothetical protein
MPEQEEKKGLALAILMKGKEPPEKTRHGYEPGEDMEGYEEAKRSAANEIMGALEAKDVDGLASSLKDFISVCVTNMDLKQSDEDEE